MASREMETAATYAQRMAAPATQVPILHKLEFSRQLQRRIAPQLLLLPAKTQLDVDWCVNQLRRLPGPEDVIRELWLFLHECCSRQGPWAVKRWPAVSLAPIACQHLSTHSDAHAAIWKCVALLEDRILAHPSRHQTAAHPSLTLMWSPRIEDYMAFLSHVSIPGDLAAVVEQQLFALCRGNPQPRKLFQTALGELQQLLLHCSVPTIAQLLFHHDHLVWLRDTLSLRVDDHTAGPFPVSYVAELFVKLDQLAPDVVIHLPRLLDALLHASSTAHPCLPKHTLFLMFARLSTMAGKDRVAVKSLLDLAGRHNLLSSAAGTGRSTELEYLSSLVLRFYNDSTILALIAELEYEALTPHLELCCRAIWMGPALCQTLIRCTGQAGRFMEWMQKMLDWAMDQPNWRALEALHCPEVAQTLYDATDSLTPTQLRTWLGTLLSLTDSIHSGDSVSAFMARLVVRRMWVQGRDSDLAAVKCLPLAPDSKDPLTFWRRATELEREQLSIEWTRLALHGDRVILGLFECLAFHEVVDTHQFLANSMKYVAGQMPEKLKQATLLWKQFPIRHAPDGGQRILNIFEDHFQLPGQTLLAQGRRDDDQLSHTKERTSTGTSYTFDQVLDRLELLTGPDDMQGCARVLCQFVTRQRWSFTQIQRVLGMFRSPSALKSICPLLALMLKFQPSTKKAIPWIVMIVCDLLWSFRYPDMYHTCQDGFRRICNVLSSHKFRKSVCKYAPIVLQSYFQCQHRLQGWKSADHRTLQESMYFFMDTCGEHEKVALNAVLNNSGRVLLRAFSNDYTKMHKFTGQG